MTLLITKTTHTAPIKDITVIKDNPTTQQRAIINTNDLPVYPGYTKALKEIESNPIPYRTRIKSVRNKVISTLRDRGYSKKASERMYNGMYKYYIVYQKYYMSQPINPGILCLAWFEDEVDCLLKDTHENLIELYWKKG